MAEGGGGGPQLGGYHYEFVSAVPDKLKCAICLLALRDAVQIANCGHRFCKVCIDQILSRGSSTRRFVLGIRPVGANRTALCPLDKKSFSEDKVFNDIACQREVLDLFVMCPSEGCSWTGELREIEAHESSCSFKMVNCFNDNCEELVMRSVLTQHMTSDCKWRIITCAYCIIRYHWISSEAHNDKCQRYPLPCVNSCGKRDIPRNQMTEHVKSVCPAASVPCKYEHVGCRVKIRRDALQDHVKESVEEHLDLACAKLKQMEDRAEESRDKGRLDLMCAKLERLEDHVKGSTDKSRLDLMCVKLKQLEDRVKGSTDKSRLDLMCAKLERLEEDMKKSEYEQPLHTQLRPSTGLLSYVSPRRTVDTTENARYPRRSHLTGLR